MSLTEEQVVATFEGILVFESANRRVAFTTCKICGAAVFMDPANAAQGIDAPELHYNYHQKEEHRLTH